MLRIIPLIALAAGLLMAACMTQPATETPPTPTAIGTPRPEGSPTALPPPTPTPRQVVERGRTIKQYAAPPPMSLDPSRNYTATINTNLGPITLDLYAQDAPLTVNNFVFLAREGFYDGVIFHRVIPDFMVQGGDPTGTGTGGPGYQFADEFGSSRVFDTPGILAMANAGPNTNGSQFFITVVPTPHLNGGHTIFGKVTQGQDIVVAISLVATNNADRPLDDVVIRGIEISEG